jgi:hypothetical protein
MANLQDFIGQLNQGFQRPNRFKCFVDIPTSLLDSDGQTLVNKYNTATNLLRQGLLCSNTTMPSRRAATTELTIYGYSANYPVGIEYQDLSCTFLCPLTTPSVNSPKETLGTTTNDVPGLFYSWMNLIQDHRDDGNLNLRFADGEGGYRLADGLKLETYSDTMEITGRYRYKNVYPISVDAPQVDWTQTDFMTLTVSFAYTHWVSVDKQ